MVREKVMPRIIKNKLYAVDCLIEGENTEDSVLDLASEPRIELIRADILRNADFPCRRSRDVERRHGLGIIPICRCVNGFGSARQPIVTAKGIDKSRILSRQV